MRHDPRFIATIAKLVSVLHTHPPFRKLSFERLCDYLAWYWNHGTFAYVMNENDTPAGVCLIKLFDDLPEFLEEFVHDPRGQYCMIVLLAADTPIAMGQLFDELVGRWGPGRLMMWERGERTENGAPRMFTWEKFERLARRLTYGLVENTNYL